MEKEDRRHFNPGGKRPGAGRPNVEKRKTCAFRMDKDVEEILDQVENKSVYINECIRKDNV